VAQGGEGLIEETCARCAEGAWPESLDPLTGAADPGVTMVSPITSQFVMYCDKGHELKRALNEKSLTPTLCTICKVTVGLQTARIEKVVAVDPAFGQVGAVAFDGITSISDWVMDSLAERSGRNELGGEKGAIAPVRSGGMIFGSSSRAHYGFAQTQARRWMHRMATIPNLKLPVIVTGLESRSEDTGTSLPYYGPQIAGQAMTGKVPQWVGNYLGTQMVIDEKGRKEWRLYLTEYRGEDGAPHIYKTRAEYAGLLPDYLADELGAEAFSKFSLGYFFDLLEGITSKSMERVKARFPDAPGLPARKEVKNVTIPAVSIPSSGGISTPMAPSQVPQAASRPAASVPRALPPSRPPVAAVVPGVRK